MAQVLCLFPRDHCRICARNSSSGPGRCRPLRQVGPYAPDPRGRPSCPPEGPGSHRTRRDGEGPRRKILKPDQTLKTQFFLGSSSGTSGSRIRCRYRGPGPCRNRTPRTRDSPDRQDTLPLFLFWGLRRLGIGERKHTGALTRTEKETQRVILKCLRRKRYLCDQNSGLSTKRDVRLVT